MASEKSASTTDAGGGGGRCVAFGAKSAVRGAVAGFVSGGIGVVYVIMGEVAVPAV